jgi:molecular chaperone DnaK (HSP70)
LPEPFAVYQYYRYGEKHPLVAERRRHHALVIDFGGGTFDVCVITTTKEGDISQGGRMARPLSASSNPIGCPLATANGHSFRRVLVLVVVSPGNKESP